MDFGSWMKLGRGYGDEEEKDENFWILKSYIMILGN